MRYAYRDLMAHYPSPPTWWDEYGVPRHGPFHPSRCPSIYDDEAMLFACVCQSCQRVYPIGVSSGVSRRVLRHAMGRRSNDEFDADAGSLLSLAKAGEAPGFGDPPCFSYANETHGWSITGCGSGPTMTPLAEVPIAVWERDRETDRWELVWRCERGALLREVGRASMEREAAMSGGVW